jgi:hypothetical protein
MKRLVSLFVILLSVIFIAHTQSERAGLSAAAVSVSQKEISEKLNELDARITELQTKLYLSHIILKNRGHIQ